jgi:hypothetical protein
VIAEVIQRKGQDSFKRLSAYVLNERDGGRSDPVDWKLAEYILDRGKPGEKVASHRITNCLATDAGFAVKECLALAARNTRSTKDKSYHLVVSFPVAERPTDTQMIDIENTLVKAAGFEGHKRISAVHQNTDNWHLHVAIVTVHPKTLRNVTPYYDHYKLQQACIDLEQKHNLTPTHHAPSPAAARGRAGSGIEAHTGRISFAKWVMEHAVVPVREAVSKAACWADVHAALQDYGLAIKPHGAGLAVVNQTNTQNAMKASAIDRSLSLKALTDRLGPFEPATETAGKAPIMQYVGLPRGADPGLWARYQAERQQTMAARTQALAELHAAQIDYTRRLNGWYRERHANARAAHLNLGDRLATRRTLETEFDADHARRRRDAAEARKQAKAKHSAIAWETFLAREGSRGDLAAMKTLEQRIDMLIVRDQEAGQTINDTGRSVGLGRSG